MTSLVSSSAACPSGVSRTRLLASLAIHPPLFQHVDEASRLGDLPSGCSQQVYVAAVSVDHHQVLDAVPRRL